jgi:chromosome segregation protein
VHLKSLTLKGFKSFPDRTRLEFSPGVSVVVGPNGSGKSNITDAVLWALGEQSPLAVRGQSMQDVIFAGAHGVHARSEALVEVVLDNTDQTVDLPAAEISISRRLDRNGDGEYRLNGARCRLVDVLELMSDTGLGREMHSVVSQGRVEAIVTSKPRDRRMLIEEAAGLGKHRRRRRRAQSKLERTQDNLDRALDVEREARSRLRPLKRQAEAAELHERLERQYDEARWTLARDAARTTSAALRRAEDVVAGARQETEGVEHEASAVGQRRAAAERALSARGARREALASRFYAARGAAERIGMRAEAVSRTLETLESRIARRAATIAGLERQADADVADDGAQDRLAALEAQMAELARDRSERVEQELADLERRRRAAAAEAQALGEVARKAARLLAEGDASTERLRRDRREAEVAVDRARRESARIGAELAAANQFLRLQAGAPGGRQALGDAVTVDAGYELAVAAALGPRLRSAVAADLAQGLSLLDSAGRDGGSALLPPPPDRRVPARPAPVNRAQPLIAHVRAGRDVAALRLVELLLDDVWVVEDLGGLPMAFTGTAVTREGRVWSPRLRELRQVPAGGEDRVLAERNRRDSLVAAVDGAARAQQAATVEYERAQEALVRAELRREELAAEARASARAHADAQEHERHLGSAMERRRNQPDDGPDAARRAQVEAAMTTERRLAERAARERADRDRRIAIEHRRRLREEQLLPLARRLAVALAAAVAAVSTRVEGLDAELAAERETGDRLAAELSACSAEETRVQERLKQRREQITRAEVAAQQARDHADDAMRDLAELGTRLGLEAEAAAEPLADEDRAALGDRMERLRRRREQLGPVNPLAAQQYADALQDVEQLEGQREDLESALRELERLIRDTDRRIREAFDETFAAAAGNFEEVVGQLFPGGRGRLRLVHEEAGPRPVLGGRRGDASEQPQAAIEAAAEAEEREERGELEDDFGVEIEITPAGKATRRLSLLSGGEKSMTALAFLFAVFLARPCPFYILDEVEAALDDLNIDRFLTLLRRVSDRAQFVVVTHQRRTMEAADCLYGVSMAGNGVSKVVSRRLPREESAADAA